MRWVHRFGLIPFKFHREYPMMDQYFSKTATSHRVSLSVSLSFLTTGVDACYQPILSLNLIRKLGELTFLTCIFIQNNVISICPLESSAM
jgi:hypothetical protein